MSGFEPRRHDFGRTLADVQDELCESQFDFDAGRARLLATDRPRAQTGAWVLLAAAVLSCMVAVLVWRQSRPLSFRAGNPPASGSAGQVIDANGGAGNAVRFSDGTTLTLEPEARARVVALEARGARVELERGRLFATVVARPGADWRLHAGPYQVRVKGTAFALSWDPDEGRLRLRMEEGVVEVAGPGLAAARTFAAGEYVELTPPNDPAAAAGIGVPAAASAREAHTANAAEPPPARSAADPPPMVADAGATTVEDAGSSSVAAPSWTDLAAAGKHREALATAESVGFDRLCEEVGEERLVLLADTARLAGNDGRAAQAYSTLRRRFAGANATRAAFMLGRMAADRRGDFRQAARWFEIYLAEQPSGVFAREAAGRRFEALARSGDMPAARAAATRYLEQHPGGPHADEARKLLAQP